MPVDLDLPKIGIIAADSIEQLAERIRPRSKYFTLFLAWDALDIGERNMVEIFQPLVDRGLAYFCAWGNRCREVHDAVDMCVVEEEIKNGEADYLLMTTWHEEESLEDAFWFFKNLAIPGENEVFSDFERYVVVIDNPQWADQLSHLV